MARVYNKSQPLIMTRESRRLNDGAFGGTTAGDNYEMNHMKKFSIRDVLCCVWLQYPALTIATHSYKKYTSGIEPQYKNSVLTGRSE